MPLRMAYTLFNFYIAIEFTLGALRYGMWPGVLYVPGLFLLVSAPVFVFRLPWKSTEFFLQTIV